MSTEERVVLKEFIEAYRENPCLWDMNSPLYRMKEMKHAAWVHLTGVLKKLDPGANVATTKKKIENLRAVYFRELKKVRASGLYATDEDVYIPNLWYYKLIGFLDNNDWGPGRRASDPLQEGQVKPAPQSDEDSVEIVAEIESAPAELLPPKRKRPVREQSIARSNQKSEPISHIHNFQTYVEPLNYPELQTLQGPANTKNINPFGIYVGEQLDQMSTFQRDVAEKLISEVLFLAKTGNLNYDSKITPSKLNHSRCQSPETEYVTLSPRKREIEDSESEIEHPRLLKELLTDGKQK